MRVLTFLGGGLLMGAILGFVLANKTFKAELEGQNLISQSTTSAQAIFPSSQIPSSQQTSDSEKLSKNEIKLAIAQADKKPDDVKLQESLGLALYQYSIIEQDSELLGEVEKLLERARNGQRELRAEVLMALGNAYLAQSRLRFDKKRNLSARTCYLQILQRDPQNKDAYLNVGLTYFYDQPGNFELAEEYYKKTLAVDQSDQNALENLITLYLETKNSAELQKIAKRLQEVNPKHPSLINLQIQLAQEELK